MTGGAADNDTAAAVAVFLQHADLTADLGKEVRNALAAALEPVSLRSGETLLRQGEDGDALYFVVHGRLGALVDSDDGPRQVGRISAGMVVGELALLGDVPRLATVVALRDSELLRLPRTAFDRITTEHPSALRALTATVVQRLAERSTVPTPTSTTVAILRAGAGPSIQTLATFIDGLATGLRRYGTVVEVTAADHTGAALGQALHAAEDAAAFVLLIAEDELAGSTVAVRSADVVLLVAGAGETPRTELSRLLADAWPGAPALAPPAHAVVLHERRQAPNGARAWLDLVTHGGVFHLRTDAADVQRLARFLAGRSVGVALGGGGARGFAHLGVLRALDEAGIAVDAIGGTSIGALVAGFYAMGWDADEREERALEALTRSGPLLGVTLPVLSLSSATKLQSLLTDERYFGQRQIEDLWLPYCCVSADLSSAQTVVHRRGPLALSVRASASLPGVLPPVAVDGNWLVDGGVLNNLPVTEVRAINGDGPLIAVDVRPKVDLSLSRALGPAVSGWSLVGRRGRDIEQRVPSLIDVLVRSNGLGSVRALQDTLANRPVDLLVEPPVANHRILDFKRGPALIRTAYEHTIDALDSAPATLWP